MAAFHIPTAEEVAAVQYAPMPLLSATPPPPPPLPPPPAPAPAPPVRRPGPATIVVRPRPTIPPTTAPRHTPAPPHRPALPPAQQTRPRAPLVVVHPRQRGNPLLARLRGVAWEFAAGDAAARQTADYCVSERTGVLFLSLQFHLLDPAYVVARLLAMRTCYTLRVLLVLCDVPTGDDTTSTRSISSSGSGGCTTGAGAALEELNVLCVQQDTTLLLAWSNDEAAQYVAALKLLERRSAAAIREPMPGAEDTLARVVDCLTQIRSVNRTDALALMKHFGVCNLSLSLSLSLTRVPLPLP